MICPFCNREMIERGNPGSLSYFKCSMHSCLVLKRADLHPDKRSPLQIRTFNQTILCKDQFEICYDEERKSTSVFLHPPQMKIETYTNPDFILEVPGNFNVTPDNFDEKLKILLVFS